MSATARAGAPRLAIALEASARPASVAARRGERDVERTLDPERAHASDLLPALAALVAELGALPRDVDAIVLGLGPGSYTGLRVAAATALGLARATGAAAIGVPSCDTLAWSELAIGETSFDLLDARGGAVYLARVTRRDDDVERELGPIALRALDASRAIGSETLPIFADASAIEAASLTPEQRARCIVGRTPHASALLDLGLRRLARNGPTALDALEPLYLRAFGVLPDAR